MSMAKTAFTMRRWGGERWGVGGGRLSCHEEKRNWKIEKLKLQIWIILCLHPFYIIHYSYTIHCYCYTIQYSYILLFLFLFLSHFIPGSCCERGRLCHPLWSLGPRWSWWSAAPSLAWSPPPRTSWSHELSAQPSKIIGEGEGTGERGRGVGREEKGYFSSQVINNWDQVLWFKLTLDCHDACRQQRPASLAI